MSTTRRIFPEAFAVTYKSLWLYSTAKDDVAFKRLYNSATAIGDCIIFAHANPSIRLCCRS